MPPVRRQSSCLSQLVKRFQLAPVRVTKWVLPNAVVFIYAPATDRSPQGDYTEPKRRYAACWPGVRQVGLIADAEILNSDK